MLAHALLALQLALLVAVNAKIHSLMLSKCCGEFQMLSGDGKECVDTDWPRNASKRRNNFGRIESPMDEEWLSRWLAPGIQPKDIWLVDLARRPLSDYFNVDSVNVSARWNTEWRPGKELPKSQITFALPSMVVRSHPEGGIQEIGSYCVDAALAPLGPFALLSVGDCTLETCVRKCCDAEKVLVNEGSAWKCQTDSRGYWSPHNSSFAKYFDRYRLLAGSDLSRSCPSSLRMVPLEDRLSYKFQEFWHELLFSTRALCFDNFLSGDGILDEGVFYCDFLWVSAGILKLLSPLCFVSTLLLAGALVSIACNASMRLKTHGLCLGCHATCLFAFNVGQITYYMTRHMLLDEFGHMLAHRLVICENFAIFMYFLQIAGWSWLTCVCINMTLGFRKLQVARSGGGKNRKKLLALSSFGWGLPLIMTTVTACTFKREHYPIGRSLVPIIKSTYIPTLQETRVCFNEFSAHDLKGALHKLGSGLHYYLPVFCLALANIVCLTLTLKQVQFLKRGNSVLWREEDRAQRQKDGDCSDRQTHATRDRTATVDAKTVRLYLKMVLMTGTLELFVEFVVWSTFTKFSYELIQDNDRPYRAGGYVTDCIRAACVAWLAAPDGGYWRSVRKGFNFFRK